MAGHTLLAGVHRSLKDADTPWDDKVKLARFAWCSAQCFLPNKQQVLLDWVCNALANHQNNRHDLEDKVVTTLWQYLRDILHSQQMKNLTESSASVSIRDNIYPVLCDALHIGGKHVAMATACCHAILHSSTLDRSLTEKYNALVDLLAVLLRLVTECLESQHSLKNSAIECLEMLLKKFGSSHRQRQLQAHRKAFTAVFEKLLVPALTLYTSDGVSEQVAIKDRLEELILTGLFNKDMCEVYTKYLTIEKASLEGKDKFLEGQYTDIENMVKFLQKESQKYGEKDSRNPILAGLPVLYSSFVAAYRPTADVKFAMLKKLCGIMGLSLSPKDSGIELCEFKHTLPALEQMLKHVYINDVYVISVDNSEDQPKFQWFLQLLRQLLTSVQKYTTCMPSASFFNILRTLLDLNHLLIEEELTQVWNVSLQSYPSKNQQHRVDSTVDESRTVFLGALMQTYVKLRQFDKLLEHLLESLRLNGASLLGETTRKLDITDSTKKKKKKKKMINFSPGFVHRFCQCIQELPPGLTLDLWKILKDELVKYISRLPNTTDIEPPKKKRKSLANIHVDPMVASGMELAAVTFHLFLTSTRVMDVTVTKAMSERAEVLMDETLKDVIHPLHALCQRLTGETMNEQVLFATLLLTYTTGELQLILLQHTKYGAKHSKYGSADAKEGGEKASQSGAEVLQDTLCIGDYLHMGKERRDVVGGYLQVIESDNHRLQHLVHLVRAQQLRTVLLYGSSEEGDTKATMMDKFSEDVLGSINLEIGSDTMASVWDGQICSISASSYPIAYLHILTQTFSMWLPQTTSTQHSNQLASLLVQSFSSNSQHQQGYLTMSSVARSFLSSDVCMESKELQTELLSAAFQFMSSCVASSPKKSPKKHKSSSWDVQLKYGKLLSMLTTVTDDQDKNWETLESAGKELSELLQDGASIQGGNLETLGDAVRNVQNILKALEQLPLNHMLPSNQDRCMLGLVIMDVMVTSWLSADHVTCYHQLVQALCFCRNLEIRVLKAMKSTGLLKCFEVGSMLAFIITKHLHTWECIQETSSKGNQGDEQKPYVELDEVTQMLVKHWMQKAAERVTLEEGILTNMIKLTQGKMSTLAAEVKSSSSSSASLDHLRAAIPLLSTVVTILHRTAPNTQTAKNRTCIKAVGRLRALLRELLEGANISAVDDDMHAQLIGCLAKCAVVMVTCLKPGGKETNLKENASDESMEVDEGSEDPSTGKSKKRCKVANVDSGHGGDGDADDLKGLWDCVLEPMLQMVLRHIGRVPEENGGDGGDKTAEEKAECDLGDGVVLPACFDFVRTACDVLASDGRRGNGGMMMKIWSCVSMVMSWIKGDQLKGDIERTASCILECMEVTEFTQVLEQSIQILSTSELTPTSVHNIQACIMAWKVLPECQQSEEKHRILQLHVSLAVVALHCLLVEAVRDWSSTGVLVHSILTTMKSVMASSKKLLEPKQAMQTLQASLAVPLTSIPDEGFQPIFSALYFLLKSLHEAFPQAVLHSIAAYMASLQHMMRGMMRRCHQTTAGCIMEDQDLFSCAENMERLLTQLSSHKKEVGRFVIVMISEYINELQKGTLLPFVKKALVVGFYNLVDVCDEKALALLQATMPLNMKEIYTEFYSDYKKYHKYKGKV